MGSHDMEHEDLTKAAPDALADALARTGRALVGTALAARRLGEGLP